MYSFNDLKKLAKQGEQFSSRAIKVAVLADSATQFLCQAIKGYGVANKVEYKVWEADYGQIERQVFDPSSELYTFQPDYLVILKSSEHILHEFYHLNTGGQEVFAKKQAEKMASLCQQVSSQLKTKIIINTFFEINDSVFGNYANKVSSSFLYQTRRLNIELMELARQHKNLFILDLAALTGQLGYNFVFDPKMYVNGDMVYSLDTLPQIALQIHSIIQSVNGQFKKCLILDLDNTLWGGIIGDDGVNGIKIGHFGIGKAFTELQSWAKQLKNRGIILAVCSKNTESIAKEPFEQHPDMELRLEDIAIFVANWENKVDNIRHIQSILQIGFDSMVFLDDNPFERNMIKSGIPELTVPDLPEDPSEYLVYLRSLNLFETASFTEEDSDRTKQYQEEAERAVFQKSFANEAEYLQSLEMRSDVSSFTPFTIPRVAQLTQRSNQFNLRTQRYTEAEVEAISNSPDYLTFSFTLEDKFGNHGLICAIILRKQDNESLFIDTWIMSCRVLKRGMEQFTLSCLAAEARKNGFTKLLGEYLPTPKNGIVKDHYQNLGFTQVKDKWVLNVAENTSNTSFITINKNGIKHLIPTE